MKPLRRVAQRLLRRGAVRPRSSAQRRRAMVTWSSRNTLSRSWSRLALSSQHSCEQKRSFSKQGKRAGAKTEADMLMKWQEANLAGVEALKREDYQRAIKLFTLSLKVLRDIMPIPPQIYVTMANLGACKRHLGHLSEAQRILKEAYIKFADYPNVSARIRADTAVEYAVVCEDLEEYSTAHGVFSTAVDLYHQAVAEDEAQEAKQDESYVDAIGGGMSRQELKEKMKEVKQAGRQALAQALHGVARCLEAQDKIERAAKVYVQTVSSVEDAFGDDHEYTGEVLMQYGQCLLENVRAEDALKVLKRASDIFYSNQDSRYLHALQLYTIAVNEAAHRDAELRPMAQALTVQVQVLNRMAETPKGKLGMSDFAEISGVSEEKLRAMGINCDDGEQDASQIMQRIHVMIQSGQVRPESISDKAAQMKVDAEADSRAAEEGGEEMDFIEFDDEDGDMKDADANALAGMSQQQLEQALGRTAKAEQPASATAQESKTGLEWVDQIEGGADLFDALDDPEKQRTLQSKFGGDGMDADTMAQLSDVLGSEKFMGGMQQDMNKVMGFFNSETLDKIAVIDPLFYKCMSIDSTASEFPAAVVDLAKSDPDAMAEWERIQTQHPTDPQAARRAFVKSESFANVIHQRGSRLIDMLGSEDVREGLDALAQRVEKVGTMAEHAPKEPVSEVMREHLQDSLPTLDSTVDEALAQARSAYTQSNVVASTHRMARDLIDKQRKEDARETGKAVDTGPMSKEELMRAIDKSEDDPEMRRQWAEIRRNPDFWDQFSGNSEAFLEDEGEEEEDDEESKEEREAAWLDALAKVSMGSAKPKDITEAVEQNVRSYLQENPPSDNDLLRAAQSEGKVTANSTRAEVREAGLEVILEGLRKVANEEISGKVKDAQAADKGDEELLAKLQTGQATFNDALSKFRAEQERNPGDGLTGGGK